MTRKTKLLSRGLRIASFAVCFLLLFSCSRQPVLETGTESPEDSVSSSEEESVFSLAEPEYVPIVDRQDSLYSYEDMYRDIEELAERYPDRFSFESIGKSLDDRDIPLCRIGDPDATSVLLVSAAIHAREYLTAQLVMLQAEAALHDPELSLPEGTAVYLIPMCNPDGVSLTQFGAEIIRSEQVRENVLKVYSSDKTNGLVTSTLDTYFLNWKSNAAGVDLNRNFDILWEDLRTGIICPSFGYYKGSSAASEPETKALQSFVHTLNTSGKTILAHVCVHAQGEVVYWNCGQPDSLKARTRQLALSVSDYLDYKLDSELVHDSSFSDWTALEENIVSITVEIGHDYCPLPFEQLEGIYTAHYSLWPFIISALQ